MTLLNADHMSGGYGGSDIISKCTIEVGRGEVAVIVGPNGAGKSTAMKAIFGMIRLSSGSVILDGIDITALPPQARVEQGMAFVPQTNNVFASMTVEENLEMGAYLRRDDLRSSLEQVYGLFPILKEKRRQAAGELSGGQRQQLAGGRALMTEPTLLMLDEPTAGLDPNQVRSVRNLIRDLAGRHTVLISSHILSEIEMTCDRVVILHEGRLLASGALDELMAKANAVVAEVKTTLANAREWAAELALGQAECAEQPGGYVRCRFANTTTDDVRETIFASANERGWPLRELSRQAPSLEDLFVSLTRGREGVE